MTQLQNLLGEDGVRWALWGGIGLVALLALLLIIIILKRIFAPAFNMSSAADRRGRPPRLGVTDFFNLDRTGRRLVIVRRDNVEHLVMVGGPNDIVIETNIVRGLRPEIATVDSAGRPTVQPRQIENGGSEPAPAGVFETGLPQRDIIAARSAPASSSPEPRAAEPLDARAMPPRNVASPAFEPKVPDNSSTESRFAEQRPVDLSVSDRRPEALVPAATPPQPDAIVPPPTRAVPMRQATTSSGEQKPSEPVVAEPRAVPEFRAAKLVPTKPVAAAPEPVARTEAPPKPDFQLPDFEELAALARDTGSAGPRQAPPPSRAPEMPPPSRQPADRSLTTDAAPQIDVNAAAPQRNWPGPLQAAQLTAAEPPTADAMPAADAVKETASRDTARDIEAKEPPKRASFEDVSKRLQDALRRPQSLTPSAITTSTARATAVAAPIQPAPFSPVPSTATGEKPSEPASHDAGSPPGPSASEAVGTSERGAAEQNDELDLEQEMARLLGRAPGSRQ